MTVIQTKFTGSTSGKDALNILQDNQTDDVYPKLNEVEAARDGETSLLGKEQAQDTATTTVSDEVIAARDGKTSLLAKEQAQDTAIGALSEGSGVLIETGDSVGFLDDKLLMGNNIRRVVAGTVDKTITIHMDTFTDPVDASGQIFKDAIITACNENEVDLGTLTGGTQDLNLALGRTFKCTVSTATQAFTLSNVPTGEVKFEMRVTNGGSQSTTWFTASTLIVPGGNEIVLTEAGMDRLQFSTNDQATNVEMYVRLDIKEVA